MDDINKYAAIWDAAQEKGIFKDAPKPPQPRNQDDEDSFFGADFFGQNRSAEYDIDEPINEVDSKYWATLPKISSIFPVSSPTATICDIMGGNTCCWASMAAIGRPFSTPLLISPMAFL